MSEYNAWIDDCGRYTIPRRRFNLYSRLPYYRCPIPHCRSCCIWMGLNGDSLLAGTRSARIAMPQSYSQTTSRVVGKTVVLYQPRSHGSCCFVAWHYVVQSNDSIHSTQKTLAVRLYGFCMFDSLVFAISAPNSIHNSVPR